MKSISTVLSSFHSLILSRHLNSLLKILILKQLSKTRTTLRLLHFGKKSLLHICDPLLGLFSGRLHQVPKQPELPLTIYIFTVFSSLFFLTIYPHPPCQEKPEKTHDFWQSVYELFPRAIKWSIQGLNP